MAYNFTDFEITQQHARIINDNWPAGVGVRRPEVRKSIPGIVGKRITDQIRSGIWMKPLGSEPARTFSSVRDVKRSTLMAFVSASTTAQSREVTDYEKIRDLVRELFHDRRGTEIEGEMYSRVYQGSYDLDDSVARMYDVDLIQITSWFREDRIYDVH